MQILRFLFYGMNSFINLKSQDGSGLWWSTIDSITQNEESNINYDYVMKMRNNKFEHTVEMKTSNNAPLKFFFSLRFELWNLESDTFHNHTIT